MYYYALAMKSLLTYDVMIIGLFTLIVLLLLILILKISLKTKDKISKVPPNMNNIDLKDFLGREPIKSDYHDISEYLFHKKVLVTGGAGSIGSELCRQIIKFYPSELIILDCYENTLYNLEIELIKKYPDFKPKIIVASARDKKRLDSIFKEYKPDIVFHAAAHKHVPLMESNPTEAVKNNIFGTLNLVECADKYETKNFVLISTDKAVNPTNIMGATKRVCEMIVQGMNYISKTKYVTVRFGNVLGSNGSVIPLFVKQIDEGGPVTVTNKYVTRYFMLISEAVQLILQAAFFSKGGEIFILDMGNPVKIYDLANSLITQSGLIPNQDIKIEIIGLRPGEKLHEELYTPEEHLQKTPHDKIFVFTPSRIDMEDLKDKLNDLENIVKEERYWEVSNKLSEIVPNYKKSPWKN